MGTGAYAANGGMLILELDDGAVGHGGRSGVRPGLWMVLCCFRRRAHARVGCRGCGPWVGEGIGVRKRLWMGLHH